MKITLMALVIAGTAIAGCGTVRENQLNETPVNQKVEYDYRHTGTDVVHTGTDVVYVEPTYHLVPAEPHYRVVPVTRYYYVD
jgi:hypothetical protein